MKDKLLFQIANLSILNVYQIEDNGLMYGKAGVMLYLFLFAKYKHNKYIYNYANTLLDGLLSNIEHAPSSFENGLAGFGWALARLKNKKIVDRNLDSVFNAIDDRLIKDMCGNLWSGENKELLYFAERLKMIPNFNEEGKFAIIISYFLWLIEQKKTTFQKKRTHTLSEYLKNYQNIFGESEAVVRLNNYLQLLTGTLIYSSLPSDENKEMSNAVNKLIWNIVSGELFPAELVVNINDTCFSDKIKDFNVKDLSLSEGFLGIGVSVLKDLII